MEKREVVGRTIDVLAYPLPSAFEDTFKYQLQPLNSSFVAFFPLKFKGILKAFNNSVKKCFSEVHFFSFTSFLCY